MPHNQENIRKILFLTLATLKLARKDLGKDIRKSGLSYPQFGALRMIKNGSATIAELSKQMMLEPATLVPVIDILESKGLLKRATDPKDRRKNLLALTTKGEQIVKALPLDREGALSKALEKIGAQKSKELIELLHNLVEAMQPDRKILEEIKKFVETK